MPNYRRYRIPGGCYFFTVNLLGRRTDLLVRHIDSLREALAAVRKRRPFHIDAWVVLPDHMHCVWTLPEGDQDFSTRWRLIKTRLAAALPRSSEELALSRRTGERCIWQRRFWEHAIHDDHDYAAHVDYVHVNPLKHGLVQRVADWPHSTFGRYVERGIYPFDWGGDGGGDLVAGERVQDKTR